MVRLYQYGFKIFTIGFITVCFLASCEPKRSKEENTDIYNRKIDKIQAKISPDSIETNIRQLTKFYTRHTASDTVSDTSGIGAARRWIYDQFKRYQDQSDGRLHVRYTKFSPSNPTNLDDQSELVNVLAFLPGTQLESKDRMYLVTAHYDSRVSDIMDSESYAPGASDNASGTAAVLELARVMSNYEFDATIVFLALSGKEQGQLGAKYFAEQSFLRNQHIDGVLNNDKIGNYNGTEGIDTVRIFASGIPGNKKLNRYQQTLLNSGGENDTPSRQLGRFIHRISQKYIDSLAVNMIYRKDRYGQKGDHLPFLEYGYPAIRISQLTEKYGRHDQDVRAEEDKQYSDLTTFINFKYVTNITKLNSATLASLADAPASPQGVEIIVEDTHSDTKLKWEPNQEPDLKGYKIVWRRSSEPYWQHSKFVGDTLAYRLKGVPRDDFIFGVCSVDNFGHISPAVFPTPGL